MKKLQLLCLLSLLGYSSATAQLTLVPKAGFSYYSTVTGETSNEYKFKGGFLVGVGVDTAFNKFFSIKLELVYIQKGWISEYFYEDGDFTSIGKSDIRLHYIEVPVMFKFTFGEITKFFINGGPYVGHYVGGKDKWDLTQFIAGNTYEYSGEDKIKNIDNVLEFGGQAGLGVLIIDRIMLEARYSYSLTNRMDKDQDIKDDASKNYGFQLIVSVPIRLN